MIHLQRSPLATGEQGHLFGPHSVNGPLLAGDLLIERRRPSNAVLGSDWGYLSEEPVGVRTSLAAIEPTLHHPMLARLYPAVHQCLRDSQVPVLAVWVRNDEIFGPDGAMAIPKDAPDTRVELLDGGHFVLESNLDEVAELIHIWRAGF